MRTAFDATMAELGEARTAGPTGGMSDHRDRKGLNVPVLGP